MPSKLTGVCYWINHVRLWSKTSGKTASFSSVLNDSSLMSHFLCQRPTHPFHCCSEQFAFLILSWDHPHLPVRPNLICYEKKVFFRTETKLAATFIIPLQSSEKKVMYMFNRGQRSCLLFPCRWYFPFIFISQHLL